MHARSLPLGVLLAGALAWGSIAAAPLPEKPGRDEVDEESAPDRITPALAERIAGKAGLEDVRVDAFWSRGGKATTARVFGNGVGVWQREVQFALSKKEVLDILTAIQKARFGSMPDHFGESEEGEKDEGPELIGQLVVHAGTASKSTLQLVKGEQSKAFARLVGRILAICEGPARKGVRAASMTDALRLLASGGLAPEILEASFQRRPDPKGPGGAAPAWTLRLAGLRVSEEQVRPGQPPTPSRALRLSGKEFHELVALLAEADPAALPQSLYAASYTDFSIEVLKYSRRIAGRRFLGMTVQTHGDQQKAFDRIIGAFEALRRRIENGGALPTAPVTAGARPGG